MSLKATVGAASRSLASFFWNSSRYSSGTIPTSRNESTWPTFMAAPFIVPSASTICSAASMWRRSSAAVLPSSLRATLAAWVPACRIAWPAARPPIFAVRPTREVGILSLATTVESMNAVAGAGYGELVSTREPGTISSLPSGQRTHALWPPS